MLYTMAAPAKVVEICELAGRIEVLEQQASEQERDGK